MIRTEDNKLIIEIETTAPGQMYSNLMHAITLCVQGAAEAGDDTNPELIEAIAFLMELHMAMLPSEEQTEKMFKVK